MISESSIRFQSRLGFSGRLDFSTPVVALVDVFKFQSRLGFLVVSTTCCGPHCPWRPSFNPVLGFLVVSTSRRASVADILVVSIPSWVFWSSRHTGSRLRVSTLWQFQSRLGFSGRLDVSAGLLVGVFSKVSIPSWVFWSSRPPNSSLPSGTTTCFNPVLGFLVVSTCTGDEC